MRIILSAAFFCWLYSSLNAQNNALILHNAVAVNIENGAVIVIAQSNASGIVRTGTSNGVILSESETDRVAWLINNSTGSYTIPFGRDLANVIPMTYNITAAGSNPGTLVASTYPTAWQNTPMPSVYAPVVTTMTMDFPTDNLSEYVVDRFYVLRSNGDWATRPSSNLTLGYADVEWTAASNTITETNLSGQYWNTNQWSPGWYTGSALPGINDAANNRVTSIDASSNGNLYTWILVDRSHPLPVELSSFDISCNSEGHPRLQWSTASETNNAGFAVERSADQEYWHEVTFISGAGNSNSPLAYYYDDQAAPEGIWYYRLIQKDFDGTQTMIGTRGVSCQQTANNGSFGMNIFSDSEHQVYVSFSCDHPQQVQLDVFDLAGRLIFSSDASAVEGLNSISHIYLPVSEAIYFFRLSGNDIQESKKFFLQ